MELNSVIKLSEAFAVCASHKECTIRKLRRTITKQRAVYNKLKTEMQQKIKHQEEMLTQKINILNILIADFQQQIADLTMTHTQLTARVDDLQGKIAAYEALLNSMPQKYNKLYTELSVFCTGLVRTIIKCCMREIFTMIRTHAIEHTGMTCDDMNTFYIKLKNSTYEYQSTTPFKSIESIYANFYSLQ